MAEVRFLGNASFPDDSLALAIVTRNTECRSLVFKPFCLVGFDFPVQRFFLRDSQLAQDRVRLQAWYGWRGFREAEVEADSVSDADGRTRVAFSVREGPPTIAASIDIRGAEGLSYDDLGDDLPIQAGDRLSVLAMDETRDLLRRRLQNRGYARAEVFRRWSIRTEDPYRAAVTFDVYPGPRARYGPVTVTGNTTVSNGTILNTLRFRSGDQYRKDQLVEAQGRLIGLDILRSAQVTESLGDPPDSIVPIGINVVEGDAYRFRYGAGWTSSECLDAEVRATSRNFKGGGRLLQLRGRVSNVLAPSFGDVLCWQGGDAEFAEMNWLASVDFSQPWIFSTRNRFNASLFGERQSLPDVYIRQAIGLDVQLTRMIGPTTPLTASYRPELSRLDAAGVLFCSGFLICTPEDISILEGANWIAPVGLTFNRNRANNILNATSGYTLLLDIEHASRLTGSNFRYDRVAGGGTWYESVGNSKVVAARFRGGWVGVGTFDRLVGSGGVDVVHPQKRFYAGGANSVRGVAQSRLGPGVLQIRDPRVLLDSKDGPGLCTPEQLIDLSCDATGLDESGLTPRPTGGTRVLEANLEVRFGLGRNFEGVTFADVGQLWGATEPVDLSELEVTPGVGVRYLSPIGPIRVDVAYRFRGGQRLSVVTSQIRRFDDALDDPEDRLSLDSGVIPFVFNNQLAVLTPTVLFADSSPFSFRRFQLHISIGQAF